MGVARRASLDWTGEGARPHTTTFFCCSLETMAFTQSSAKPRWYLIPIRVVLVTFVVTLLSFAASLFLGILGTALAAWVRGAHPNMALAYRDVAFPIGVTVGVIVLISATVMEVRHYRQSKALHRIADQMQRAS